MKRVCGVVLALALVLPGLASAQKRPSNTMHTNSAELYITQARKETREPQRIELFKKALERSLEGIQARPDNPKAYLLAGQVYVQLGNVAAADSMFDKAEELWPDYKKDTANDRLQAWVKAYNAGIMALRDNKPDEGIAQFKNAAAIYQGRPEAQLQLAQLYQRTGDRKAALENYKAVLDIVAKADRKDLKPEELALWKEWEQDLPVRVAQLLAMSGNPEEAIAAFKETLAKDPNNTAAQAQMALLLMQTGKQDEAAAQFNALLEKDLTENEAFNVGVGLFRANQHDRAATAFRKAIGKNPYLRDAWFNLGQALLAIARGQVESKDPKVADTYQQILGVTDTLLTFDPANLKTYQLRAFAARGMSESVKDPKVVTDWKNKTLAALQGAEALPFEVSDITIGANGTGVQLAGAVVNLKGNPGEAVKLRIHFLGRNGGDLGTQEVTVSLPQTQAAAPFQAALVTKEDVAGWKYEVVK